MHHVLGIAEILASIFGLLDRGSNAMNARVCKQWTEVALDVVWKSAKPAVFRSLAPTTTTACNPSYGYLVRP